MEEQELLEATGRRFKEHVVNKYKNEYPSIGQFIDGSATVQLSAIIPLEYLKKLVWHYQMFEVVTRKPPNPKRSGKLYVQDDLRSIEKTLRNLRKRGWLEGADVDELMWAINEKVHKSPNGQANHTVIVNRLFRNRSGGAWKEYARKFIVSALVKYATNQTSKPHYGEIAGFLQEQEILDCPTALTVQAIRRKISSRELLQIRSLYITQMVSFEQQWFLAWADANKKDRLTYDKYQAFCLSSDFDEFFPPVLSVNKPSK